MRVHVVSLSDRPSLTDLTWPTLLEFCARHHHSCTLRPRLYDGVDRAASWHKILLLQEVMATDKEAGVVLWVDDDVMITNPGVDILSRLRGFMEDHTTLLAVGEDVLGERFNAGVMACKNTPDTAALLQRIWDACSPREKHTPLWEQTCMQRMVDLPIKVLPTRVLQSFLRDYNDPHTIRWQFGDFAAHISGMPLAARLERARFVAHHLETGECDDQGLQMLLTRW